jgi:hypothetical protein
MHPALISTLIAEHTRDLRRRAEQRRMQSRPERPVRTAPWPP